VAETLEPGAVVAEVARRWQVCSQQVFTWRREMHAGAAARLGFVPIVAEAAAPEPTVAPVATVPAIEGEACRRGAARGTWHRPRTADDGAAGDPGVGGMIAPPAGARILLATKPVDFRKGAHSLAALAAEVLGADPFSGCGAGVPARAGPTASRSSSGTAAALSWSGSSWRVARSAGRRWWTGVVRLTPVEFAALFDGIDWRRVQAMREIPTPSAPA
jgi:transposase